MVRAIAAVVLAIVAWLVAATVGNWVLRAVIPGYSAVEASMEFSLPMMVGRLALGVVSSVWAGAACAAIAGERRRPPVVAAVLLTVFFLPIHYMLWDKFPAWYHAFFLISLAPSVLAGAALMSRLAPSR
jgi:hypothetical protein